MDNQSNYNNGNNGYGGGGYGSGGPGNNGSRSGIVTSPHHAAFKKNAAVMAAGVLMPTLSPPNTSNKLMTNGTQLPI